MHSPVSRRSTAQPPKPCSVHSVDEAVDHLVRLLGGQRRREVGHHLGVGVERGVGRLVGVLPRPHDEPGRGQRRRRLAHRISSSAWRAAAGSTPLTTSTPRAPSRTNVSESHRLLVPAHQCDELIGVEAGGQRRVQLVGAGDDVVVVLHRGIVDAVEQPGQVGGVDQSDGDGLAVLQLVVGGDLQRVGQRVAVVEQRSGATVGSSRSSPATTSALIATQRAMRSGSSSASRSSPVRKWYLAISPRPQRHWRGGSVASASRSQITPLGCQIAPTRFLPSRQVDRRLAADRRVDHPEQRGGDVDDRHAAVPGGSGEPADVGDDPAAVGDDHVVAGEPHPGEAAAQRLDRRQRLVLLAGTDREALERDARVEVERDAGLGDDRRPPAPCCGSSEASSRRAPCPTSTS